MKRGSGNRQSYRSSLTDLMIFKNRWWQHLIFWAVAMLILLKIFQSSGNIEKIDLIYTIIFLIPVVTAVYLNLYLAIPRFLGMERYLLFSISFLLLLGGGALFLYFLFDRWIDFLLPDFYFISYYNVPTLMLYTGSLLVITMLLKLSRSWFMLLRVDRMSTAQQLQSLQSQINPHFLLNSLQSIYALSLEKSDRAPETILQLSNILKYTLYETGQPTVKLEKEIALIRDYVDMYRKRSDPRQADITLEVSGDPEKLLIAPMVLIPFIENAFKHGLSGDGTRSYVHITIAVKGRKLNFRIRNSCGANSGMEIEQAKGIGIRNTRQRLELLYPGRHELEIAPGENTYCVNLIIKLNP